MFLNVFWRRSAPLPRTADGSGRSGYGYNAAMRILIVGCGDVARRVMPLLLPPPLSTSRPAADVVFARRRPRVFALLRDAERCASWRAAGATPLLGDLDQPASLKRLAGIADVVLHFAPPPNPPAGKPGANRDSRTRHLLAALAKEKSLPQRLIYISTTGVYGDCAGTRIDETRPARPASARARRRVDAESELRRWGRRNGVAVSILRAPGIYAHDRLPLERLRNGTPALAAADDVFTNHIHADDLARAAVAALRHGLPNRVINVCDDSDLRMGDYFDRVADAFALPHPPRLSRQQAAEVLSPLQLSFMSESRRIGNRRLKEELRLRLRYPSVLDTLAAVAALPEEKKCWS
jgi:nucleoside-diphosphate-sugar epimerase